MLIRREDFGNIEDLSNGSEKKIWFTCESCGTGVLQAYKNYLRQKDGKFCRPCRQRHTMSKPERKLKAMKKMKEQWKDNKYREKMSKSLSESCKKAWDRDDGTRRKMVSENTSKGLKKRWKDDEFIEYQKRIQTESQNREKVRLKKSIAAKKQWENEDFRNHHSKIKKGKPASNKYSYSFIKRQYEEYDYKLISKEYKGVQSKLQVKCDKGHVFRSRYWDFKNGHLCPYCSKSKQFSKAEKEISSYIKSFRLKITENNKKLIKPLELDIIIPEKKLAIEYCGLYWHSEEFLDNDYHFNKLKSTNEAGYRLITIFEDEWIGKREIVKSRLKYFLGLNTERIYARKCKIREISKEEAREFIDKYHIQGFASATIYLGAFYNEELVAVNTFVKKCSTYELNRFCVNKSIVGIASKLLKYFQRNYEWENIITFADLRWSEGDLYEKIGFKKVKELRPDYSYFEKLKCNNNRTRHHKFGFRHAQMKNKLENYNPDLSEHENMLNNGWLRIYDCGKIKYSIKK